MQYVRLRDEAPAELDAFGFQAHPLFQSGFTAQQDAAAAAYHSLPRHTLGASAEGGGDGARGAGKSGGRGDLSIGRDLPPGNRADRSRDSFGVGFEPGHRFPKIKPAARYNQGWQRKRMDLEKVLLRKVGEAIHRFGMIRDGDRVAVALSGGKDSLTLLEALLRMARKAPIEFSVCAFTVEQGKFLRPIEPLGEYLKARGIDWTYYRDNPSFRLLDEQPDHGCDLCSRYRRRAVYQIARGLGANVIAFGHTADDFCEALFRNTMFTGKLSSMPPVTKSRDGEFRLIRPLVFVTEEVTSAFAASLGAPVIPCGCSQRTGTVRRSIRDVFAELEQEYPHLKENILSAMGNIDPARLLDTRYLEGQLGGPLPSPQPELFPIVMES